MLAKVIRVIDKALTFFEEWTLFITVMVALIALFFNVVLRYGFNYSLAWSEELV
ncbi:MAG: TRAP transporter small permease, partial [Desulfobacteraceae bacterium]|nr:TRAP transporter small permease [Desulfobacteraceae bacterium]